MPSSIHCEVKRHRRTATSRYVARKGSTWSFSLNSCFFFRSSLDMNSPSAAAGDSVAREEEGGGGMLAKGSHGSMSGSAVDLLPFAPMKTSPNLGAATFFSTREEKNLLFRAWAMKLGILRSQADTARAGKSEKEEERREQKINKERCKQKCLSEVSTHSG